MTSNGPALLAAAAGVGFGHAILPDHWVPLAVLGRTRRYPLSRVARLSGLAGVAHVLVSILLGALIIVVGLEFRSTIQSAQDTIIGWILIATGIGFAGLEHTVTATAMTATTTTTTTTTMTTTTLMSPNTITTGAALTGVSGAKGGRNAECVGWQR